MGCVSSRDQIDWPKAAKLKEERLLEISRVKEGNRGRTVVPNTIPVLPLVSTNDSSETSDEVDSSQLTLENVVSNTTTKPPVVVTKPTSELSVGEVISRPTFESAAPKLFSRLSSGDSATRRAKNAIFAPPLQFSTDFRAPVFAKAREAREFIVAALKKNFIFSTLTEDETEILIDAFEQLKVKANEIIIRQGGPADFFYVIFEGHCFFTVDNNVVGKASHGQTFGELALLYQSPRAASVKAETDCTLFRVDQTTFRFILQTQTLQAEQEKSDLLGGLPFFKDLEPEDVTKLAATMCPRPFRKGDVLAKKGEPGDAFYLIQKGKVKICDISVGANVFEDETLGPGDSFGERALTTNEPRTGNCIALTDGTALVIDQPTFEKVLGNYKRLIHKTQDKRRLAGIKVIADTRLDNSELFSLANLIVDERHGDREVIVTHGVDMDAALYLVRQGLVEIVSKRGRNVETVVVEPGGYFGEDFLLADVGKSRLLPNSDTPTVQPEFTATALGDVIVGRLALAECRGVVDTTQLGYSKRVEYNSILGNSIRLEELQRHRILGAGAFGQVQLVSKTSPRGRKYPFALKIQSKYELVQNGQAYAVIREKNIMSKLQHPFIINLVQAYQDKNFIYMLLELHRGGELSSVLRGGHFDGVKEVDARFYAACILDGLSYMHRRKILYRDLKPENVLISSEGYPVLVDLGFAKIVPDKTFTLCGTPEYLAPEVILNRGHDKGADHWSFGILVYEMITGVTPFYEYSTDQFTLFDRIANGQFTFPTTILPSGERMSVVAENLIERLLVKNPTERLGSLANGEKDIYNHLWFHNISFNQLMKHEIKAPWIPEDVDDPLDCSNFYDWNDLESKTKHSYPKLSLGEQRLFDSF